MKTCDNCCGLVNDAEGQPACAFGNCLSWGCNGGVCKDWDSDYVMFGKDICDFAGNIVFMAGNKYKILSEEHGNLYVSHGKKNKNECSIIPSDIPGMRVYKDGETP